MNESDEVQFIDGYNALADHAYSNSKEKGFHDHPMNVGEKLMLMVSELAEAMEDDRHGRKPDDKVPEYLGIEAELADTIIRIMDFGKAENLRVAEALVAKMKYNTTREKMHGGKKY